MGWFRSLVKAATGIGRSASKIIHGARPRFMKRNSKAYAEEGYALNVIVFRCVDIISKAIANIDFQVYVGDDLQEKHPLIDLLQNPNPVQAGSDFWQAFVAFRLITGNPYMEKILPNSSDALPQELWIWPPYQMKVVAADTNPVPLGYVWEDGARKKLWEVDPLDGTSNILHWKTFNPLDLWYGMSPMAAAALSVDQHNEAGKWNAMLLQNYAAPSGIISADETLNDPEFKQLQNRMDAKHKGSSNAGRWMLLEGGLKWEQIALSPKDMDWLNGKNVSAQDIAGAYGVPLQVIPLPGSQTFANYEQARAALYEDTALPLVDSLVDELNRWLSWHYGDDVRISYDVDSIEALEVRRKERWAAIQLASWLSTNEKRDATGYEIRGELDDTENIYNQILVPSGLIPLEIDVLSEPSSSQEDNNDNNDEEVDDEDMKRALISLNKVFEMDMGADK